MPIDPSLEHISAMSGQPFQAFPGQDHKAHIDAHLNFMQLNMVKNNPATVALLQKNILEHISIMAQEQVQLEFVQELQTLPMLQQQSQIDPQAAQQLQRITVQIEARKAQLIAEMTQDFAKEENKVIGQFDSDPLLKLKSREVDLRAMENEQKRKEAEDRIALDKMRAMLNQQNSENKLAQNEDLAKLRAGVSLAKQGMQQVKIRGI
jgi:hypothetical protein